MPAHDAYLANLRASGHRIRLYLGKFDGAVVLNASVSATPADQARDLSITVNSGSAADVRRGFLVRIETSGGVLKGITNVRAAGVISAANLPIRELGQADIPIVSGDVLKVYNLPYLGDKLPNDDASFAPDNLTYVDQGTAVPPRVNSGGHYLGMVDSGQSYATVATRGSLSSAEDPDSGGTITHLWTLLTGTLTFAPGSTSTDANPTLRASVGYGLAEHTVTDSSNSKAWTQYVCTQVYDDATPPYRLIDAELSADETSGWSGTAQTYAYSGLSDLYDGQFVGLFARETINGVTVSYGSDVPNRSHIKLLGFLSRDENDLDPQIRRVHLTIQSPWQRLASLPGFSKVFTREGADWTTISGLTVRLALLHLIRYYSFYLEFFDLRFDADFLNKAWSKYYLNKQTADAQIRELADGVDARAVSLRTGELLIHTHPALIALASRVAVTTTLTIAEQDCLRAPFTRDHWKGIETFELRGFIAGAADNATVFSRYPGLAPGRGPQSLAAERIIADSQSDANARCGRRAGRADGVCFNSSNAYTRAVEWDVTLPGSYDVFDFNKEYIQTSLTGASNLRGVDLSAQRYYLSRMRITYTGGTARVNPTFLTATHAPAGATYVPPVENLPPWTTPDSVPQPAVTGRRPGLLSGTADLVLANTDNHLYWIDLATHALDRLNLTTLTPALQGTLIDFVVDPFSPLYLRSDANVNGMLVTTTHAYYVTGLQDPATVALTNEYAFRHSATAGQRGVQSTRSQPGFFGVNSHDAGTDIGGTGKNDVDVTLNNGASWTRTIDLGSAYPGGGGDNAWGAIHLSEHTPNRLWVVVYAAAGSFTQVYQSNDAGAGWVAFGPATYRSAAQSLHLPYQESAESFLYVGAPGEYAPSASNMNNVKLTASGYTNILPVTPGQRFGSVARFALKTYDLNASIGLLVGYDAITGEIGVWKTADAFATFTTLFAPVAFGNGVPVAGNIAGDNASYLWLWGQRCFKRSVDGGSAWEDYSPDIATAYPTALNFLNIAGVG